MCSFCAEFCAADGTDIKFGTFLLLFAFCGPFLWGSFFCLGTVSAKAERFSVCTYRLGLSRWKVLRNTFR